MKLSKKLLGLCLATLLCACGGSDETPTKASTARVPITITQPFQIATATARGDVPVQFGGGDCGGGNGQLTATWIYGDRSSSDNGKTHIYPVSATTQKYALTVQCNDTVNNPPATHTGFITVDP